MAATDTTLFAFDHKGIGSVLSEHRLAVPLNQREYSWKPEHVRALLEDIQNAISDESTYFLGTIVLTRTPGVPEVADGQQRLATTTMILAAVRDYLAAHGDPVRASAIESQYLKITDVETAETLPRLRLNVDDNEFFTNYVVVPTAPDHQKPTPTKDSHRRIMAAAEVVSGYLDNLADSYNKSARADQLVRWVTYLRQKAQVILLTAPDHLSAFVMFETLNDRGLRASQADLLKNYLLSQAGPRVVEAQQKWSQMIDVIESIGVDELTVTYLRHVVTCRHGATRERELFATIRGTINSGPKSITFLDELTTQAANYAALFNPEHVTWNSLGDRARGHIRTLLELRVEQIRPLMLAVLYRFDPAEIKKALMLFVSWSVRFLIAGGGRGGQLDKAYGDRANEVYERKITTASQLSKAMADVVPKDTEFQLAFAEARVSQAYLARYYLRALERTVKQEPDAEMVPNTDETINLEHILPQVPDPEWNLQPDLAEALYKRLGNMVLLKARRNSELGNTTFENKQSAFLESAYSLTREAGAATTWGAPEIAERQRRLAELAVRTWPVVV